MTGRLFRTVFPLRSQGRALASCAALLLCLVAVGCGKVQLYGNLGEKEANEVAAALRNAAVEAEKRAGEEGAYAIFVDEADFARAMGVLEARALPRRRYDDLGAVFGSTGMFSTPLEEKARYLHAIQEELSQTVSAIDGVLMARVHIVLPEQDQMDRETRQPSAAVFVKQLDDATRDPLAHQRDIRRLVAASVPNMAEDRIVVTFSIAAPATEAPRGPSFRTVLGLRVAEESASRLWWYAGVGAGVCLLLAAAVAGLALRGTKK